MLEIRVYVPDVWSEEFRTLHLGCLLLCCPLEEGHRHGPARPLALKLLLRVRRGLVMIGCFSRDSLSNYRRLKKGPTLIVLTMRFVTISPTRALPLLGNEATIRSFPPNLVNWLGSHSERVDSNLRATEFRPFVFSKIRECYKIEYCTVGFSIPFSSNGSKLTFSRPSATKFTALFHFSTIRDDLEGTWTSDEAMIKTIPQQRYNILNLHSLQTFTCKHDESCDTRAGRFIWFL